MSVHYDEADRRRRIEDIQKHYAPSNPKDPPEGIKNLRKYLGLPPTDPKDPQAELREAIRKELFWITRGTLRMADNIRLNSEEDEANATFGELDAQYYRQQYGEDDGSYRTQESEDALVALFQAHQQQLLSELLGQFPPTDYEGRDYLGGFNDARRQFVEVIEKLKQTNDGGKDE